MWGPRNAYEESAPGTGSAAPLHPDAVRQNLAHRIAMAGIVVDGFDRLSAHALARRHYHRSLRQRRAR
jgi:hypothetical protein